MEPRLEEYFRRVWPHAGKISSYFRMDDDTFVIRAEFSKKTLISFRTQAEVLLPLVVPFHYEPMAVGPYAAKFKMRRPRR